jgi:hypothetical protein
MKKIAQLQKQIEDCNPYKGNFFDFFLKKIVKNRGLGLVCKILKTYLDYKSPNSNKTTTFFIILHVLLSFNVKSFLGC